MSTQEEVLHRLRRLRPAADPHVRDLRQRRQERGVPAAERVQARHLGRDQHRRDRHVDQQGRPLHRARLGDHVHGDDLHRQPDAGEAEQGADGGRGDLRHGPQADHHATTSTTRWPRRGSRSSPRSSSSSSSRTSSATSRCRPTPSTRSTSSASRSPRSPSTRRPRTSRSRWSSPSSSGSSTTIEGIRAHGPIGYLKTWLPAGLEDMNPIGKGADLRDRGDLALRPPDLALRSTLRQHPRRPPAAALHGRRAGGAARPRRARRRSPSRWPSPSTSSRSCIVAGLQAFIFSILTAIYLGEATSESH